MGDRVLTPSVFASQTPWRRGIPVALPTSAMDPRLRLDVLIPTHDRARLLDRCVRSVLHANAPAGLHVHVTVICNACTDDSRDVVRRLQITHPGRITLLEERRRGKSKALNAGIAATGGDLVGMIDDDEEVSPQWLEVIARAFADSRIDFIGGPYVPLCDAPLPSWLPEEYFAVLGVADSGSRPMPYGRDFPGILKGGNAVIRRSMLERVGPYAEHLGPGAHARLFSCEDEDMYWRLVGAGATGQYCPDLVIYHCISSARFSREYYRRWCFWRGLSRGLMDRRHPLPVTYFAGVPRFLWGRAARALVRLSLNRFRKSTPEAFTEELRMWDLAGYFYGRHVYTLARYSPIRSRRASGGAAVAAVRQPPDELEGEDVELAG
jgi:glycosyltransferase involved in cell wall biosynthesis